MEASSSSLHLWLRHYLRDLLHLPQVKQQLLRRPLQQRFLQVTQGLLFLRYQVLLEGKLRNSKTKLRHCHKRNIEASHLNKVRCIVDNHLIGVRCNEVMVLTSLNKYNEANFPLKIIKCTNSSSVVLGL